MQKTAVFFLHTRRHRFSTCIKRSCRQTLDHLHRENKDTRWRGVCEREREGGRESGGVRERERKKWGEKERARVREKRRAARLWKFSGEGSEIGHFRFHIPENTGTQRNSVNSARQGGVEWSLQVLHPHTFSSTSTLVCFSPPPPITFQAGFWYLFTE